ncbi:hypothetical protein GJ688_16350 [Heliobacillus mobilis]|uniref:SWIM-type domain-containing protein n=1 Tax=Heliobacterium mobile TaxID=28064 RepID=A0A6I3SR09_HELMO|nr:SWIM zinc finger family protein [Heliobacterium mobile]MTV50517.1 hypothetical protein [Heliobacterium mobile]
MGRWDDFYYRPSKPKAVTGGIKAQSQRGAIGKNWWTRQWIQSLERLMDSGRLSRGRTYARKGQVLSIDIDNGTIHAKVQGSRTTPYKVRIQMRAFTATEWKQTVQILSEKVVYAAKLLSGQMPADIDQVFQEKKLSLFPYRTDDLKTDCSCPDWANPCKHVAAVYYLLGEELDRDPFLLFRLRGKSWAELAPLLNLGDASSEKKNRAAMSPDQAIAGESSPLEAEGTSSKRKHTQGSKSPRQKGTHCDSDAPITEQRKEWVFKEQFPREGLPADPKAFWGGQALPENFWGELPRSSQTAPLIKQLGPFPLWRGQKPLEESLEPAYRRASQRGRDLVQSPQSFLSGGSEL